MWIKLGATFPKVGWYPELRMVIKYILIIYKVQKTLECGIEHTHRLLKYPDT